MAELLGSVEIGLLFAIAMVALLPLILFLVSLWRIGTALKDLARAHMNEDGKKDVSESLATIASALSQPAH